MHAFVRIAPHHIAPLSHVHSVMPLTDSISTDVLPPAPTYRAFKKRMLQGISASSPSSKDPWPWSTFHTDDVILLFFHSDIRHAETDDDDAHRRGPRQSRITEFIPVTRQRRSRDNILESVAIARGHDDISDLLSHINEEAPRKERVFRSLAELKVAMKDRSISSLEMSNTEWKASIALLLESYSMKQLYTYRRKASNRYHAHGSKARTLLLISTAKRKVAELSEKISTIAKHEALVRAYPSNITHLTALRAAVVDAKAVGDTAIDIFLPHPNVRPCKRTTAEVKLSLRDRMHITM